MPTHYLPACPTEGIIVTPIANKGEGWWRVTTYGRDTRTSSVLSGKASSIVDVWRRDRDRHNRRAQWQEHTVDLPFGGVNVEAVAVPRPMTRSERIDDLCDTIFYASVFAASRGDRARVEACDQRVNAIRAHEDSRLSDTLGNALITATAIVLNITVANGDFV